jgi:hypothetical protein
MAAKIHLLMENSLDVLVIFRGVDEMSQIEPALPPEDFKSCEDV